MAACVVLERNKTSGRVVVTAVVFERPSTDGRVPTARIVPERVPTDGRVAGTDVVQERILTEEGVRVDEVAAFLTIRSRLRRKRKAGEREWNEQQSERTRHAVHRMF